MKGAVYYPPADRQPYLAVVLSHDEKTVLEATPCATVEEAEALLRAKFKKITDEINSYIFKK